MYNISLFRIVTMNPPVQQIYPNKKRRWNAFSKIKHINKREKIKICPPDEPAIESGSQGLSSI
jgi:hypothetical protein